MFRRAPTRLRLTASVLLAYALVLQGLLGALGVGAHAAESRVAAQLGVICTIHGIADPMRDAVDHPDTSPGKLACVEHCVLLKGQAALPLAEAHPAAAVEWCAAPMLFAPAEAEHSIPPPAPPPPPRGPPSL